MDSARMRCAALVGAKPAKLLLPLSAEVLPVATMAPVPAWIIAGATRRARCRNAMTLVWKLRSRAAGSICMKFPKTPPTGLWITACGDPRSAKIRSSVFGEASGIGDVHGKGLRPVDLRLEFAQPLLVPSDHGDIITALRKAPYDGGSGARSYPGN